MSSVSVWVGSRKIAPRWGPPQPRGAARAAGTSVHLSQRQARHGGLAPPPGCTLLPHPPVPGVAGLSAEGRGSPQRARRTPPELPAWSQPITAHVKPADAPSPRTASAQQRLASLPTLAGGPARQPCRRRAAGSGLWRGKVGWGGRLAVGPASRLVSPVGPCSAPAPQAGSDHGPHAALQVHDLGAGGAR